MRRQFGNRLPRQRGFAATQAANSTTMNAPRTERWQSAVFCLLLVALTLTVFWSATRFDFVNCDDPEYFSTNPHVLGGLKKDNLFWAFRTWYMGNWFPLTWLSYMLDVTLFGPGSSGPHLMNVLFHATNGVLVFVVLRKMTGAMWRSAVVACFFALHPLRVESVAWVAARKDVLSGLFFLLTLWVYARYAQGLEARTRNLEIRTDSPGFHVPSFIFYLLALIFFALGLMSKPMLVTLPFVLLLLDYWPLRRCGFSTINHQLSGMWRLMGEKIPFFLLSAVICAVTFKAQSNSGAAADWISLPLVGRIQNALVSYCRYLGKTFWPVDLAFPYPHPLNWQTGAVMVATALVAAVSWAALCHGAQRRYLFTGWFWFFGAWYPSSALGKLETRRWPIVSHICQRLDCLSVLYGARANGPPFGVCPR